MYLPMPVLTTTVLSTQGLTEIDLTNLDLGDYWGGERIAAILDSNASLTSLVLDENGIQGAGAERLFRALGSNIGLRCLSLSRNFIGKGKGTGHGPLHELSGLLQLNNSLSILDLSYCHLNGFDAVGSSSLSPALLRVIKVIEENRYSKSFTNLRIQGNPLLPKKALKSLRDGTTPPLVIDIIDPRGTRVE